MSMTAALWYRLRRGLRCATLIALATTAPAQAIEFGTGVLPLRHVSEQALALDGHDELRIAGRIESAEPVLVVLRIDDGASQSYATRYNEERTLPPGRFEWVIPLNGLMTASGRVLDGTDLRRLYLFSGKSTSGRVTIDTFATARASRLPDGVEGFALGARQAPLPPGFERIAPDDRRIVAGKASAVRRPAPDPLVANGIRGIERLRLPWNGRRARVSLWTEDPGEWELLPHPLQRRIRINGVDVSNESFTASEWIERRYLRGLRSEHVAGDDAWSAYGRWRGGLVSSIVDVVDDAIVIELAGDGAAALHLAAVVVEPETSDAGVAHVNAWRARWYRQTWPIVMAPQLPADRMVEVTLSAGDVTVPPLVTTAAPGTAVRFHFSVRSDRDIAAPKVVSQPPSHGSQTTRLRVWAAQWRLERRRASDTTLTLGDNMLVGNAEELPLVRGVGRTYEGWIDIPDDGKPGLWSGAIVIGDGGGSLRIPLHVDVLPVALPAVEKPAGFYLDEAPHATWFEVTKKQRAEQTVCDLALMRSFGIDGSAPAFATPGHSWGDFERDAAVARAMTVAQPMFAYAPAKRLAADLGLARSAAMIGEIDAALVAKGYVPPIWSVADEPSNPGHDAINLQAWLATLRAISPGARLAAHLNAPSDLGFAHQFDVALVNDGYGLDLAHLVATRTVVKDLWLYNTARPRTTAGLWLWLSAASRYVQWHGRMPTADPFDPTDGREGDVQMVFPSMQACVRHPTIHRDLLDMAEGLVDQRWLIWLSRQGNAEARKLAQSIRDRARTWETARSLSSHDLARIRESIIEIARRRGQG